MRAEPLGRHAAGRNVLQLARIATATSSNEPRVADASPYSNPYSQGWLLSQHHPLGDATLVRDSAGFASWS
jgi:hypothetical protein